MRYLQPIVEEFSRDKMVFIVGPRQIGKTTAAQTWLEGSNGLYLNWDNTEDRQVILTKLSAGVEQYQKVVLDELHKYARWKSWLKGLYDKHSKGVSLVVTGSARLDVFKKGGDSLLGRYELLHLHPFSVGELTHGKIVVPPSNWLELDVNEPAPGLWRHLENRSGFPEPFTRDDARQHRRWSNRRRDLLIQEDVREVSQVRNVSLIEHLALLLPSRVGSPLSVNSLREDLQVAHDTVNSWLTIFEHLFYCFRLSPYVKKIGAAIKKEQKLYLWDWSQIEDPASRFENMVAAHLLKSVQTWTDLGYGEYSLHYVRNRKQQEVDFLIAERNRPLVLIEAKLSDEQLAPKLAIFSRQLGDIPIVQLVATPKINKRGGNSWLVSADLFFSGLV